MNDYSKIIEKINNAQKILLFTHVNMDGDALGSASALCLALRKLGKEVFAVKEDSIPNYLAFLDRNCFADFVCDSDGYLLIEGKRFEADLSLCCDINDESRLENRKELFFKAKDFACIDHHYPKENPIADTIVDDFESPAVSLNVYELFVQAGYEIDKDQANLLYAGIATDTGNFKYDSTNASSLRACADLIEKGAEPAYISARVFDTKSLVSMKLEDLALSKAEFLKNKKGEIKAVISATTKEDLETLSAKEEDMDTVIDRLRIVEGVDIAAHLKYKEEGVYKLSLRSKDIEILPIAVFFNGGGHPKAAGATLNMTLDEAKKAVIKEIEKLI